MKNQLNVSVASVRRRIQSVRAITLHVAPTLPSEKHDCSFWCCTARLPERNHKSPLLQNRQEPGQTRVVRPSRINITHGETQIQFPRSLLMLECFTIVYGARVVRIIMLEETTLHGGQVWLVPDDPHKTQKDWNGKTALHLSWPRPSHVHCVICLTSTCLVCVSLVDHRR